MAAKGRNGVELHWALNCGDAGFGKPSFFPFSWPPLWIRVHESLLGKGMLWEVFWEPQNDVNHGTFFTWHHSGTIRKPCMSLKITECCERFSESLRMMLDVVQFVHNIILGLWENHARHVVEFSGAVQTETAVIFRSCTRTGGDRHRADTKTPDLLYHT